MTKRSAIASAKDDTTSLNDEAFRPLKNKKNDGAVEKDPEQCPASNNTSWLFDIPDEILLKNIIPFIGDYQYRFVGLANHALHDSYVTVYPKKQTHYSTLTKEHIKICFEENHCLTSLPVLFPLLAKNGDLEMIQHYALDEKLDFILETLNPSNERHFTKCLNLLKASPDEALEQGGTSTDSTDTIENTDLYAEEEYEMEYFLLRLLEEVHESASIKTSKAAAAAGHLQILEWLHYHELDLAWDVETCSEAAAHANFEILKWCHANLCSWDETTCQQAAACGDLEILKWCRAEGCPWDETTVQAAAEHGHLEVLKWCHANGCPWDVPWDCVACTLAAEREHDEVLKWLHDHGSPMDDDVCLTLVARGRLDLLQWFKETESDWEEFDAMLLAAEKGHLHIVKWLHEQGYSFDECSLICKTAARHGHLAVVQYCHENNCPWESDACAAAAEHGSLDILQWCHANGCPWDKATCAAAAKRGNLELLKWCRENGCPWDEETILSAAKNGHLDVLRWCYENGLQLDKELCTAAAGNGNLAMIQWCRANKCEWNEFEMCLLAAQKGQLEVLQWCHDHGCPVDKKFCMHGARFGHLDVVKWYHKHGIPCDEDIYVASGMFGQFRVQIWCLQQNVGGKLDEAAIKRGVEGMGSFEVTFRERIWLPGQEEQ